MPCTQGLLAGIDTGVWSRYNVKSVIIYGLFKSLPKFCQISTAYRNPLHRATLSQSLHTLPPPVHNKSNYDSPYMQCNMITVMKGLCELKYL